MADLLAKLPATYKKLTLTKLTRDFDAATRLDTVMMKDLVDEFTKGKGLLLVKNLYAGVNASDVMFTNGFYNPGRKPPYDTGLEGLGQVLAVSPGTDTDIKAGDYIMGLANQGGWYAEYRTIPARICMKAGGNDPRYLTLLISALTSSFALEKTAGMMALANSKLANYLPPELVYHINVKKPLNVLVTAAAGGAGIFAVQLAALAGHRVVGTCSSDSKAAYLKKIGCAEVVNYKTQDLRKALKAASPAGYDIVYESVGGDTAKACFENLAIGGKVIIIGSISGYLAPDMPAERPNYSDYLFAKSGLQGTFYLPHYTKEYRVHLDRLEKMMKDGVLDCKVDLFGHGVDDVKKGVAYLHAGTNIGKVMIPIAKL